MVYNARLVSANPFVFITLLCEVEWSTAVQFGALQREENKSALSKPRRVRRQTLYRGEKVLVIMQRASRQGEWIAPFENFEKVIMKLTSFKRTIRSVITVLIFGGSPVYHCDVCMKVIIQLVFMALLDSKHLYLKLETKDRVWRPN